MLTSHRPLLLPRAEESLILPSSHIERLGPIPFPDGFARMSRCMPGESSRELGYFRVSRCSHAAAPDLPGNTFVKPLSPPIVPSATISRSLSAKVQQFRLPPRPQLFQTPGPIQHLIQPWFCPRMADHL